MPQFDELGSAYEMALANIQSLKAYLDQRLPLGFRRRRYTPGETIDRAKSGLIPLNSDTTAQLRELHRRSGMIEPTPEVANA